jgi:hypothetical protein
VKLEEHHANTGDLLPFERFREFARRIIAVPKAEIDKQEAEYQRQRENANDCAPAKGALIYNAPFFGTEHHRPFCTKIRFGGASHPLSPCFSS